MPVYISVCASCEACELHTPAVGHRRHQRRAAAVLLHRALRQVPPLAFSVFFAHGNKRWQCWVISFQTVQHNKVMSAAMAAAAPATMGQMLFSLLQLAEQADLKYPKVDYKHFLALFCFLFCSRKQMMTVLSYFAWNCPTQHHNVGSSGSRCTCHNGANAL